MATLSQPDYLTPPPFSFKFTANRQVSELGASSVCNARGSVLRRLTPDAPSSYNSGLVAAKQLLNPFRRQSSLNLAWDRCAINRTR